MRVYIWLGLFLLLAPLVFAGSVQGDFDALMDIYAVTDGDNWYNNEGWSSMTPQTMGDAYGIETNDEGRVVRVFLEENNLVNAQLIGYDKYDGNMLKLIPGREFPDSVRNLDAVEYFNIKANQISGPIPDGFMEMESVRYLLLSGRAQREPEANSQIHYGKRRHILVQNGWTGQLPQDWSKLTNLYALEISHQSNDHGVSGPLPQSLFDLPNIGLLVLYSNHFSGQIPEITNPEKSQISHIGLWNANLSGPLPESWGQLSANTGKYIMVNNNPGISGTIPESYGNIQNLRVFYVGGTNLTGPFPSFLFHDGNSLFMYFELHDRVEGSLPEELPAQNTVFPHISIFRLDDKGLDGVLPNWVAKIRHVQFNMRSNHFSALGDLFYDHDAPIYNKVRNFQVEGNDLVGEIPDTVFASVAFSGLVSHMGSSSVVGLDMDLGVVETGTITDVGSEWIRDSSKSGVWTHPWTNHLATIDPADRAISFIVPTSTNYQWGYLYPRGAADISGTKGLDFTLEPVVEGRIIRFKLSDNRYVARKIVSINAATDEVTLDAPLEVDVSGLEYSIHQESSVWNPWFHHNNFHGVIPQSWKYIPTNRRVRVRVYDNDLSGPVPDLSRIGEDWGGLLERYQYERNRFVFRDIIPYFAAHEAAVSGVTDGTHTYAPQKPFGPIPWGEQRVVHIEEGSDLRYSELASYVSHPDNVYQWQKGDVDISGQDSVVLLINDFSSADEGLYRLRVTNSNIPDLVLYSEDILVEVGASSGTDETFDRSLYATPRSGFSVTDRVRVVDTAVYDKGYYSYDGLSWIEFSFSGEKNNSWVIGEAINEHVPTDARYYVAFSCNWSSGWVCENNWQLLEN
jgi:hypothetical protein